MDGSEWTPLPGFIAAETLTPERLRELFPNFPRVWKEVFQSLVRDIQEGNLKLEDLQDDK